MLQRGITVVGYNVQASVDAKNKLITHFDTGSVNDTNALAPVALAVKELLKLERMDVLADKGYHTGEQIQQCEQNNITTYVSPKEPASNDPDIFPVTGFKYNVENNYYICPAGEIMTTNGTWHFHSSKVNGRNIDRSEFANQVEQNNRRVKEKPDYYRQRQ